MKSNLLQDILKEKLKSGKLKFSQGRIYLFLSIIAFYACMSFLTWKGFHCEEEVNLDSFKIVVEGLKWAMLLFAGYTTAGKGIGVIKPNKKDESF